MTTICIIDLPVYDTLHQNGCQNLDVKQYNKITKILLHVLADTQIANLPKEIPIELKKKILTKYLLWEEQKRSSPKIEQATKWFQKRTKPISGVDPEQRFKKVQWEAHSRLRFPFQETARRKNRNDGAREHYETLQVEGAALVYDFIDGDKELGGPEKLWKVQRTLFHYGALIEEGKTVSWETLLVDWAQEKEKRVEKLQDLYFSFQSFFPSHIRPVPDPMEEDLANGATSFCNYVASRTVKSVAQKLQLTFSKKVIERITAALQENEVMRLHFTYFIGTMKKTLHIPAEEKKNKVLLEEFALFFHYAKHCQVRQTKERLLDLVFLRDREFDSHAPYEQLMEASGKKKEFLDVEKALGLICRRRGFLDGKDVQKHFFLLPLLHLYPDISELWQPKYTLGDITIYEFCLFFFKNQQDRLKSIKIYYERCVEEESEKTTIYSPFQNALLFALTNTNEEWVPPALVFFKLYGEGLAERVDAAIPFHFILHQIDLSRETTKFQKQIFPIQDSSYKKRKGRAMFFLLVQKLPAEVRSKIPLSFPAQVLPPSFDTTEVEKDLVIATGHLYKMASTVLLPEQIKRLRYLVEEELEVLFEGEKAVSWKQVVSDWAGKNSTRTRLFDLFQLTPCPQNERETLYAKEKTLEEYVVDRTVRSLKIPLRLSCFSSQVFAFFQEACKCEEARLDLTYFSRYLNEITEKQDTRPFSDRLAVLKGFFSYQSQFDTDHLRNALLEYLIIQNQDYENAYPYSRYILKALNGNLPDLKKWHDLVKKIEHRFRKTEAYDFPFLYSFFTKHPGLQGEILAWPLNELYISQLLYLGDKVGKFPETLEASLPKTELLFSEEERKILSLLKDNSAFKSKMEFLEKFYKIHNIQEDEKFAFDVLLAPLRLTKEITEPLLNTMQRDTIRNTFAKACINQQDTPFIGRLEKLLNPLGSDQY
ncbi:MAG: hypothetical protein K940chlam9_01312 [Chlamydiae bacterium]|nr:hypothetical protein [Chlamydiota bacterium]